MNTRKGQVGVALAALLMVACGDAAMGIVMEDGGGLLVDLGMHMMDAGEGIDSAVAQGPGPWTSVTCTTHTTVTTAPTYEVTVDSLVATFDAAPNDGRWEVETCSTTISATDANNDGCTDVQPANTTCVSSGPKPVTSCYYAAPQRLPDGTVRVSYGAVYTTDYVDPENADTITNYAATVRYRRL